MLSQPAVPVHCTTTRVRYAETDQAGVVYHSNYFVYFEMGRTDLLQAAGLPYRQVEEELGIFLTVIECAARYRRSARYDDELRIETRIDQLGLTRITFAYEIYLAQNKILLCEGHTVLAAVRRGAPVRIPEPLRALCAPYAPPS